MYCFEGDYKRRPQQNLAGASRRDEKSTFLQHAQLERNKREQQRKEHYSAVKIQAFARSYLKRRCIRQNERCQFDLDQQIISGKNPRAEELLPFVQRFLFFYEESQDSARLIWLLQWILKLQQNIKLQAFVSREWFWRIK